MHTGVVLLVAVLIVGVMGVKKHEFKTCSQSGFCRRNRAFADLRTHHLSRSGTAMSVLWESLQIDLSKSLVTADIINLDEKEVLFVLGLQILKDSTIRLGIREKTPLNARWDGLPGFALARIPEPESTPNINFKKDMRSVVIKWGQNKVILNDSPLRITFSVDGEDVVVFNERDIFRLEHGRSRIEPRESANETATADEDDAAFASLLKDLHVDEWEESFNSKTDSKPFGPSSISMDLTFPGTAHVYGIPEHASSLNLKSTRGPGAHFTEPFRLYNLDVFEYEMDSAMALYGSIPFMLAHKTTESSGPRSTGILWLNSAEMWVDVERTGVDHTKLFTDPPSANDDDFVISKKDLATKVHWMAESGHLDVFVFLAKNPKDAIRSYTALVGTQALPPLWAIAYHQCRWNYIDEPDVAGVDANFDKYDIPYDVLWLDIEHTDGKRYFTWDRNKFPNPKDMQASLKAKGRKLVTIIDPHIKKDDNYFVSKDATEKRLFVLDKDSKDYEGWCWPGNSGWLDYLKPETRAYWSSCFHYDKYIDSTDTLYVWNDMNEPSVFTGPEITMPKDNLHYWTQDKTVEHRDVHNLYGTLQQAATYMGLLERQTSVDTAYKTRPFVLSRAFFTSSQRYGAIWTGDNIATYEHLQASIPMILTISLSGISFAGADVGGFFNNPSAELLLRWYQAGTYQPFFRSHAHIDTKRREPWVFGEDWAQKYRNIIRQRYRMLPMWYTWFWESHVSGVPAMRPMFMEWSALKNVFSEETQFMLGRELLVAPVTTENQVSRQVYLPEQEVWYDWDTYAKAEKTGRITVGAPLEKIPVFIRGGSILVTKERIRRSSTLMKKDPFTLIIAVDQKNTAKGRLFLDDTETFRYTLGHYLDLDLTFTRTSDSVFSLTNKMLNSLPSSFQIQEISSRIERLVLVGFTKSLTKVTAVDDLGSRELLFKTEGATIVVKDPKVILGKQWKIELEC